MSARHKTIAILIASWAIIEIPLVLSVLSGDSSVGVAITMGIVGALFCVLAYRRKTWARHLVLLALGYSIFGTAMGTMAHALLPLYALLLAQCFLFWALCWHRPVLAFLGVIPAEQLPVAPANVSQSKD